MQRRNFTPKKILVLSLLSFMLSASLARADTCNDLRDNMHDLQRRCDDESGTLPPLWEDWHECLDEAEDPQDCLAFEVRFRLAEAAAQILCAQADIARNLLERCITQAQVRKSPPNLQ